MNASDYLAQIKALLPPGPALSAEPGSQLEGVLSAMAEEYARADDSAQALLRESDPRTTLELLPDWERVVGLPDACTPAGASLEERRETLVARLIEDGEVSLPRWIARAAALGHTIAVSEPAPMICGEGECGDELAPLEVRFVLEVEADVELTHPAECGAMMCGDELGAYSTQRLECELRRVRQAHTELVFNYTVV